MADRHVDDLLRSVQDKRRELKDMGSRLAKSAHFLVVCFVDLAESTALKSKLPADEWLGYIYEFLTAIDRHARSSKGTVVKRIGDEVMIAFTDSAASEQFLAVLEQDSALPTSSFKASFDCGEAFYLRFSEGLEDDPYGHVVDRCARIAKLAAAGTVLCSAEYQKSVRGERYVSAGRFALKGFDEPQEVFIRKPLGRGEDYVRPLLETLNRPGAHREGYFSIPRRFDEAYLASFGASNARPFIARALLNVPHLLDSPKTLEDRLMGPHANEEAKRLSGYYVEWDVIFKHYQVPELQPGVILAAFEINGNRRYDTVLVYFVPSMLEIIERLTVGQRLRLRGILMEFSTGAFIINYADLEEC
jgi:class 3 adenylate cyclase